MMRSRGLKLKQERLKSEIRNNILTGEFGKCCKILLGRNYEVFTLGGLEEKATQKSRRYETDIGGLALVIEISVRVFLDIISDILISECFVLLMTFFSGYGI